MRKKIVIFGHYGVPNWGDEAILSGILSQINISHFSITIISHNPEFTKKLYNLHSVPPPPFGIRSFFNFQWIQTLTVIKEADYIIFGGGGLWQPKPLKALNIWNFYLRVCLFFEKKIFSLGTSFSVRSDTSKNNKHYKKIIKNTTKLLQKIKFFSVRDKKSKTVLMDTYNIHEAKISITSDAAFFLEPENITRDNTKKKKLILLSMREGDLSIEQEKIIFSALQKEFSRKSHTFEFIVMQSYQSNDENFTKRHKNISLFYPKNTTELLEKISSAHFICSSRLHANILASACNTNFLAISCRDKVKNLFSEYLPENIIEASHIKNTKNSIVFLNKKLRIIHSKKNSDNNSYSFTDNNRIFLDAQKKKLQNFFPDILQ